MYARMRSVEIGQQLRQVNIRLQVDGAVGVEAGIDAMDGVAASADQGKHNGRDRGHDGENDTAHFRASSRVVPDPLLDMIDLQHAAPVGHVIVGNFAMGMGQGRQHGQA